MTTSVQQQVKMIYLFIYFPEPWLLLLTSNEFTYSTQGFQGIGKTS